MIAVARAEEARIDEEWTKHLGGPRMRELRDSLTLLREITDLTRDPASLVITTTESAECVAIHAHVVRTMDTVSRPNRATYRLSATSLTLCGACRNELDGLYVQVGGVKGPRSKWRRTRIPRCR